ncbi:MAG: hypothetical protein GXY38_10005 [Planctomycetes bacterium]|nr:hypothetical protein [Planctomycetota bacterium]
MTARRPPERIIRIIAVPSFIPDIGAKRLLASEGPGKFQLDSLSAEPLAIFILSGTRQPIPFNQQMCDGSELDDRSPKH